MLTINLALAALAAVTSAIVYGTSQAFIDGLSRGSLICAIVVALGALCAFLVLPSRGSRTLIAPSRNRAGSSMTTIVDDHQPATKER